MVEYILLKSYFIYFYGENNGFRILFLGVVEYGYIGWDCGFVGCVFVGVV